MMKFPQYSLKLVAIVIGVVAVMIGTGVWYFDIPHGDVEKVPSLHGQTDGAVFRGLGAPDHESSFSMGRMGGGEFRVGLLNFYPPSSPENENVEIRECTWKYYRYQLTIWFHKPNGRWIVLDTCRYHHHVRF